MDSDSDNPEILDREQCFQLLAKGLFGRILYTSGALPVIQPVSYMLDEETIVIRTDSLAKLAVAGRQEVVAFEIDDIDPVEGTGWSVVVTGRASEITSGADLVHARNLDIPSWVPDGSGRYIRIQCELVSGQCLRRSHPELSDRDGEGGIDRPAETNSGAGKDDRRKR